MSCKYCEGVKVINFLRWCCLKEYEPFEFKGIYKPANAIYCPMCGRKLKEDSDGKTV